MMITKLGEYKGDTWEIELDGRRKVYVNASIVDGSGLVYINTIDNSVCLCKKDDATPLHTWNTFESFLETEIKRICSLFNEHGEEKEPNRSTLPIG